jgi:hypothetical protein
MALPNVFRHDLNFSQLDATANWQFDAMPAVKLDLAGQAHPQPGSGGRSLQGQAAVSPKAGRPRSQADRG